MRESGHYRVAAFGANYYSLIDGRDEHKAFAGCRGTRYINRGYRPPPRHLTFFMPIRVGARV